MPYYIDPKTQTVFVGKPPAGFDALWISVSDARATEFGLSHNQHLTSQQIEEIAGGAAPSKSRAAHVPTSQLSHSPRPSQPVIVSNATRRTAFVAALLETLSWICLAGSIITGLSIALTTGNTFEGDSSHPFVGIGVGLAVGGTITCLTVITFAAYIQSKMEQVRLGR